jgi:hypothetical protein
MVCAPRERQAQLERVRDGLNLGKARNACIADSFDPPHGGVYEASASGLLPTDS